MLTIKKTQLSPHQQTLFGVVESPVIPLGAGDADHARPSLGDERLRGPTCDEAGQTYLFHRRRVVRPTRPAALVITCSCGYAGSPAVGGACPCCCGGLTLAVFHQHGQAMTPAEFEEAQRRGDACELVRQHPDVSLAQYAKLRAAGVTPEAAMAAARTKNGGDCCVECGVRLANPLHEVCDSCFAAACRKAGVPGLVQLVEREETADGSGNGGAA